MILIKITEEHYIVVDDSEIKENDYFIYNNIIEKCEIPVPYTPNCKKITQSTKPLEFDENGTYTYEKVKYVPVSYIKELINQVDIKAKGDKYSTTHEDVSDRLGKYLVAACFQDGYHTALEDNKHKKYTEEDIVKAIEMAREDIKLTRISEWRTEKEFEYNNFQIIKAIQPKTSWDIEIINDKLKLK